MLQDGEIKQISEETGFSPSQIERLYSRFAHLDRGNCGTLNKNDLMSIPELAINPLCDRLIQMFFLNCESDDEMINFRQFIRVLATFRTTNNSTPNETNSASFTSSNKQDDTNYPIRPQNISGSKINKNETSASDRITNGKKMVNGLHGCLRKKLSFVFRIYDADNDGRISFNDLRSILKMMVGNYIEDVQLDKIATRAFVEVDEDNDGFVEFNEFCRVFSEKGLDEKLRVKFLN